MRKFLPELVGVTVLLVAGATALVLLYATNSAAGLVAAIACLGVMVVDIRIYRMWRRQNR
jgi:hypothetical protein